MSASEIEVKATSLGWTPKEKFRGDPERWVDAETFVKKGEEMLPLIKAQNRDLNSKVASLEASLNETTTLLKASQESIEALKEFNSTALREKAKEQTREIKAALITAKKDGDVEAEVELTAQLTEHTAAIKEAEKAPVKKVETPATPAAQVEAPEFTAWKAENPWFGTDLRKTSLANGIAAELRAANTPLKGKAFLDKVAEETDIVMGGNRRDVPPKVGEGKPSGGSGGGGNGTSYSDLPKDAQEACNRQATRLVGTGRAYKTLPEWQKAYAAKYFAE